MVDGIVGVGGEIEYRNLLWESGGCGWTYCF